MAAKDKAVLLDICRILRMGNSMAVALNGAWLKENGLGLGDRVLIRAEGLKDAKGVKVLK